MDQRMHLNVADNAIALEEGKPVFLYRSGKLPDLPQPVQVHIVGDIDTVSRFMNGRRHKQVTPDLSPTEIWPENTSAPGYSLQEVLANRAVVYVTRTLTTAKMQVYLDPENPIGTVVEGSLGLSLEQDIYKINTEALMTREDFLKKLRYNRLLFIEDDRGEKYQALYDAIFKFQGKAVTEVLQEGQSSTRGSRIDNFSKIVDSKGLPKTFRLRMPLFKGQEPEEFDVELMVDVKESGPQFWFESQEMLEKMQLSMEKTLKRQLDACEGLVIINK